MEIAKSVWEGKTIDLSSGNVNVIWQGDANAQALRALAQCTCPPAGLNVSGPVRSVEELARALGRHLGMQCHVEMTPDLIRAWCDDWGRDVERLARRSPSVQTPAQMMEAVEERVAALHAVADAVYGRWVRGLAAD